MFKAIPNTDVVISDVSGEVPDLELVVSSGAAINLKDMILYFIREEGMLESSSITVETLKSLLSISPTLVGTLTYVPTQAFPGTIIKMEDLGTIVNAGDRLTLPYGEEVSVLFTTSDNGLVTNTRLGSKVIKNASVSRAITPIENLNNPSELSLLWSEIEAVIKPSVT